MVLVVVAVALTGGVRPALTAVGAGVLAGAFFLAPPYNNLGVNRLGDALALVVFALVGSVVAILVDELAQLGEHQATSRPGSRSVRRRE
jgi:two-component system sensor histidine kinase KdpD